MIARITHDPLVQRWRTLIFKRNARPTLKELHLLYGVWIAAFAFKLIGSSWDVAWHFRYLRDDFAPPHLINTFGFLVAIALLMAQSVNGLGTVRRGLRLLQIGTGCFLLAIPLDLINHRLFGLDLTSWSPTHMLLYVGTGMMIAGVLRSWLVVGKASPYRLPFALAFWAFLLEDVIFPTGQQEYGTLALDAYIHGRTTASNELLTRAGDNVTRFVLGSLPPWLYPVWIILGGALVLAAARQVLGFRWTATTIAASYVLYRIIAFGVLVAAHFPPSSIPFTLLGVAVVVDLAASWKLGSLLTAIAIVVVTYGVALLVEQLTLMPGFPLMAAPFICVGLIAILAIGGWNRRPTDAVVAT